jgi:transposase
MRSDSISYGNLLNEHQAAKRIGMAVKTLRGWRQQKHKKGLRYVKVGGWAVRYRPEDLDAFVEAGRGDGGGIHGS